jgi:hypothetical protein
MTAETQRKLDELAGRIQMSERDTDVAEGTDLQRRVVLGVVVEGSFDRLVNVRTDHPVWRSVAVIPELSCQPSRIRR